MKENQQLKIRKPEDNLWLAALAWIHILLLNGGIYLLTILIGETKQPATLLLETLWLIIPLMLSWIFIRMFR